MKTLAQAEVDRVTHHIAHAEQLAHARDAAHLTPVQRLVRQLLLRLVADYRAAGQFPKNRDFATRTPYFIDADGTRCAMAHLLELGGESALVTRIAHERNNAYVRELADEPRLLAWLEAAGLTVEEAAAIQPSYCSILSDCICGGDFSSPSYPVPAAGVLDVVVQANDMARVDAIYGDSFGITVGSEVDTDLGGFAPGTRLLIPLDANSTQPFGAIRVQDDGLVHCNSQGTGNAPPLAPDDLIDAVQAPSCAASLAEADSVWASNSCDGGGGIGPASCSASGEDSMSVGILLALVAWLVVRK